METRTYTSGLLVIISNCSSRPSPPTTRPHLRFWLLLESACGLSPACSPRPFENPLANSLPTFMTWRANSRVGSKIKALAPNVVEWRAPSLCTRGTIYAKDFPEPVRAIPTRSLGGLPRRAGIESRWIGVGIRYPWRVKERKSEGWRPLYRYQEVYNRIRWLTDPCFENYHHRPLLLPS